MPELNDLERQFDELTASILGSERAIEQLEEAFARMLQSSRFTSGQMQPISQQRLETIIKNAVANIGEGGAGLTPGFHIAGSGANRLRGAWGQKEIADLNKVIEQINSIQARMEYPIAQQQDLLKQYPDLGRWGAQTVDLTRLAIETRQQGSVQDIAGAFKVGTTPEQAEELNANLLKLTDSFREVGDAATKVKTIYRELDNGIKEYISTIQRQYSESKKLKQYVLPVTDKPLTEADYKGMTWKESSEYKEMVGAFEIGTNFEQRKKLLDSLSEETHRLSDLDHVVTTIKTRYKELNDQVREYISTIELENTKSKELRQYLVQSPSGRRLAMGEEDYRTLQKIEEIQNRIDPFTMGGIDKDTSLELQSRLSSMTIGLEAMGDKVLNVSKSWGPMENGLKRYTANIERAGGANLQFEAYVTDTELVLNRQQKELYESAKAADALAKSFVQTNQLQAQAGLRRAKQAGFAEEDLTKAYTQEPSGVAFMKFSTKDATGAIREMEVVVDKFGHVLNRTNRRLLGFFESVRKNTIELVKWSIGVTLVYGAYYKLQQVIETAIDNQTRLADVAVTLGQYQRDLNDIFDDAAKVAYATGESINDVLETYTFAYRAVGAITDPIERTTRANQLLSDATILNKLSALDAASSIDVLAGSLRQLQGPQENVGKAFERGGELLDKWVTVVRNANVDLATLSTAFSITAESAGNAGLSIEELNAVIASLAEKIGGLGGRETGNAVRALIGGVYQQQAADILAKYGIAVQDTTGQMREFLDISRDVFELYQQGIITETELNKIGLVLGGGVRRGQQYVAYLSDFGRVMEVVAEQSDSAGAAQFALQTKLDTVQTTIKTLDNSVQNLTQSLGSEGGLLGVTNAVLETANGLVTVFSKITEKLGSVTIPASLLLLAQLYFGATGGTGLARRAALDTKFANVGTRLAQTLVGPGSVLPLLGQISRRRGDWVPLFNQAGQLVSYQEIEASVAKGGLSPMQAVTMGQPAGVSVTPGETKPISPRAQAFGSWVGRNWMGLGIAGFSAAGRAGEGDWEGAGITFAGGAIGALTGGPVGAIIGSAIADSFVRGIERTKGEIGTILADPFLKEIDTRAAEEGTTPEVIQAQDAAKEAAFALTGGEFLAGAGAAVLNLVKQYAPNYAAGIYGEELQEEPLSQFQYARLYAEDIVQTYEAAGGIASLEGEYQKALEVLRAISQLEEITPEKITPEISTFGLAQKAIFERYDEYLADLASEYRDTLRTQLTTGEIPVKDYREALEAIAGSDASVSGVVATLKLMNNELEVSEITIEDAFNIMTKGSTENVTLIFQLVKEIEDLSDAMQSLEGKAEGAVTMFRGFERTAEVLSGMKFEALENLNVLLEETQRSILDESMAKISVPQVITTGYEGYSTAQLDLVAQRAREMQEIMWREMAAADPTDRLTEEWLNWMIESAAEAEPIFIYLGEQMGYYMAEGLLSSDALQRAFADLVDKMQLPDLSQDLGYQFMDVTAAEMRKIMPQYNAIRRSILSAGGTSEETGLLTFFKDSTSPVYMQKDWKIVQHLLSKILETEEKQLDGIYNLPGGAAFYVPFDAYKMFQEGGGGGGSGGLGGGGFPGAVDQFGGEVDKFGSILDQYANYNVEAIQSLAGVQEFMNKLATTGYKGEPTEREFLEYTGDVVRALQTVERTPYLEQLEKGGFGPPAYATSDIADNLSNAIETLGVRLRENMAYPIRDSIGQLTNEIRQFLEATFGFGGRTDTSLPNYNVEDIQSLRDSLKSITVEIPEVSTNLALNVNTRTQLVVDGQLLAEVIKPYLHESLIEYQGAAGSATQSYSLV